MHIKTTNTTQPDSKHNDLNKRLLTEEENTQEELRSDP